MKESVKKKLNLKSLFIYFYFPLLIFGCNIEDEFIQANNYYKNNKTVLLFLKNELSNKENITMFIRKKFDNLLIRLFNKEEISYRIENYETDLQIEINLKNNFENESIQIEHLLEKEKVKCSLGNDPVNLSFALNYFSLNKSKVVNLFSNFKEHDIIYFSRFKENTNSVCFLVRNKFYLIYSEKVNSLNLDENKSLLWLEENWYFYDGDL